MSDRAELHEALIQLQLNQLKLIELKSAIDKQFDTILKQSDELVIKMTEHLVNCVIKQNSSSANRGDPPDPLVEHVTRRKLGP